jgi:hypothetical protein
MKEKVLVGPKFGTLIHRKWITNIWVVTGKEDLGAIKGREATP